MLKTLFLYVAVINIFPAYSDSENVSRKKRSEDYVPCERGWYYFRDKCYKAIGRTASERLTWQRALDKCKSFGANLASIQSQEEQDFIVTFLQLDVKHWVWVGLHDHDKEGDYKWTDGSVFNYTYWNVPYEPNGKQDDDVDCVHLLFQPGLNKGEDLIGKWNDRSCQAADAYACEMNANPRKRSPNPMYCSSESGGGWKYDTSCYHIVTEMKSWQNAEDYCKTIHNGHLVTVSDLLEDYFLDYILANMTKELWIGIKIQEKFQQKWTSGWYVSYDGFNEESNFMKGNCVAWKKRKEWITVPCSKQLPFICETSTESPPVLKLPAPGSHCPNDLDDWRDFGGEYCYHIETEKSVSFYEANFNCKRRGGDLVSLHSQEEVDILFPFVKYKLCCIFIGLFRLISHEGRFAWTDGSAVDYENWDHNEPNDYEEQEKCTEARTFNTKWNDCNCEHKKGYICSVKKIATDSRVSKPQACDNFCVALSSYLYGIISQCSEAKRIS